MWLALLGLLALLAQRVSDLPVRLVLRGRLQLLLAPLARRDLAPRALQVRRLRLLARLAQRGPGLPARPGRIRLCPVRQVLRVQLALRALLPPSRAQLDLQVLQD